MGSISFLQADWVDFMKTSFNFKTIRPKKELSLEQICFLYPSVSFYYLSIIWNNNTFFYIVVILLIEDLHDLMLNSSHTLL